jgi:GNAT superfamily N-acetyltransferase
VTDDSERWRIRPGEADDVRRLQAIEIAAGQLFIGVGMPEIAADGPYPTALLLECIADGRLWSAEVAAEGHPRVVGYAFAEVVDGAAHLGQVSVDPAFGRRGVGRGLVRAVAAWALHGGLVDVTLTTFRAIPWNAPLYERLGFAVIPESEIGPGMAAVRAGEAAAGLDPDRRVCMRAPAADLIR